MLLVSHRFRSFRFEKSVRDDQESILLHLLFLCILSVFD